MNKQIEKLANDLRDLDNLQHNPNYTAHYQRAVGLHSLGYRRQEYVAREIFEEIEEAIMAHGTKYAMKRLAELKKKYIG